MKNFKKTHPLFFTKTIGIEPLFEVRGSHLGPKYNFYEILTIFFSSTLRTLGLSRGGNFAETKVWVSAMIPLRGNFADT